MIRHLKKIPVFSSLLAVFLLSGAILLLAISPEVPTVFLNSRHNAFADFFFGLYTRMGETAVVLITLFAGLFHSRKDFWAAAAALALGGIVTYLFKHHFFADVPRPAQYLSIHNIAVTLHETGWEKIHLSNSFPSGHTLNAFAGFSSLAFMMRKPWQQSVFFLLALLVGISRMYLGQHFLHDVMAGAFLGYSVSALCHYFAFRLKGSEMPYIRLNGKK